MRMNEIEKEKLFLLRKLNDTENENLSINLDLK